MVLPDSDRVSRAPSYLGTTLACWIFEYGIITLYDCASQRIPLILNVRYEPPRNPSQKFQLV